MSWEQGVNTNADNLRSMYVLRERVTLDASHDGKTRQEFADECDINVLLATYETSGVLNHYNAAQPAYLDVTDVPDLQTSLEIVEKARIAFMTLPARARAEFDNDPVKFMQFAQDEANRPRMEEWGLLKPKDPEPAPVRVEVTNQPGPAPEAK